MDNELPPDNMSLPAHAAPESRMSLGVATGTPLPPSSAVNSPQRDPQQLNNPFANEEEHTLSPLDTSMSNMNRSRRSSAVLNRKSSASSLRNGEPTTPRKTPSRRTSSNIHASSPTTASSRSPMVLAPEKEPLSAAAVATDYFRRELERHTRSDSSPDTVVFLHDSCYGHRYSRPKTSKNALSTIVERPERILAGALGVSAAYVRLAGAHVGGESAPHPHRTSTGPLPFRIQKTARQVSITSPVVTSVHGTKWMEELRTLCNSAGTNLATTGKELGRTQDPKRLPGQPAKEKLHEGDLYLCPESLEAFQGALGGVFDAVDTVFEGAKAAGPSRAFVCIRPPGHHCAADYPSGFCWLNNVHVGIEHAAQQHGLTHAAIIDFDLHHGDGSQAITWERNARVARMPKNTPNWKKTSIGYFSLHDINSYPCEYGDQVKVQMASLCLENAHGQSIWNVHLQPWKTDAEFWDLYETRYNVLIDKARAYLRAHTARLRNAPNQPRPKAAIFISAGFDASEWESQGMQRHKVNVPTEFYARFTQDIVALSEEEGTGVDGRVVSVLEGGYSDRALMSGVLSHLSGLSGVKLSKKSEDLQTQELGLGVEMNRRMAGLSLGAANETPQNPTADSQYDTDWWHSSRLSELELLVYPAPPPVPKKAKNNGPATFAAPTQSFSAKVVDPSKIRRTVSGTFRSTAADTSRPPTPPPPDVEWTVATHELSKLLIPTDRQTRSCKPEELVEPRTKKERQSIAVAPVEPLPSGRQLRGRKAKTPNYSTGASDDDGIPLRTTSRASRRQTIADWPMAPETEEAKLRQPSRRLSIASSISSTTASRSEASHAGIATQHSRAGVSRAQSPPTAPDTNGVRIKKRESTATKPEASKPRTSAKPQPAPRVLSSLTSAHNEPRGSKPSTVNREDQDVDQLTSGLKRITIKVPPKDEYEARQRKPADEATKKKAPPKTTNAKKPPATRTTKAGTSKTKTANGMSGPPPTTSKVQALAPADRTSHQTAPAAANAFQEPRSGGVAVQERPIGSTLPTEPGLSTSLAQPMQASFSPIPSESITASPNVIASAQPPPAESIPAPVYPVEQSLGTALPQFIPFNAPDSQMTSSAPPQHQPQVIQASAPYPPLQWLPPNSDTALPASIRPSSSTGVDISSNAPSATTNDKPRYSLPTFTANGAIPFATPQPMPPPPQSQPQAEPPGHATGATVGAPGDYYAQLSQFGMPSCPAEAQMAHSDSKSHGEQGVKVEDPSIWDIPDTPAKK